LVPPPLTVVKHKTNRLILIRFSTTRRRRKKKEWINQVERKKGKERKSSIGPVVLSILFCSSLFVLPSSLFFLLFLKELNKSINRKYVLVFYFRLPIK
jgi:hypothetical protein